MDRREAIKRTSVLLGGTLSAPVIAGLMKGCTPAGEVIDWKPVFFTDEQAKAISVIADVFIPTTDTPGAKEVGVPQFIDTMANLTYDEEYQGKLRNGLDEFLNMIKTEKQKPFDELDAEVKIQLVGDLNKEAVATVPLPPPEERSFLLLIKELIILGYCMSEVGASKVLQYDPVPGAYIGCVPYEEVGGKQWASR